MRGKQGLRCRSRRTSAGTPGWCANVPEMSAFGFFRITTETTIKIEIICASPRPPSRYTRFRLDELRVSHRCCAYSFALRLDVVFSFLSDALSCVPNDISAPHSAVIQNTLKPTDSKVADAGVHDEKRAKVKKCHQGFAFPVCLHFGLLVTSPPRTSVPCLLNKA